LADEIFRQALQNLMTTKFILILHLCMFEGEAKCISSQISKYQFEDHYSCVRQGYMAAYKSLDNLTVEEINDSKLAVRIECKQINIKGKKI
jgi:hypothetical protein